MGTATVHDGEMARKDQAPARYLTVQELAEKLGESPQTIHHWARTGKIPHFKFGKRLKFHEGQIEEWIRSKFRPSGPP